MLEKYFAPVVWLWTLNNMFYDEQLDLGLLIGLLCVINKFPI